MQMNRCFAINIIFELFILMTQITKYFYSYIFKAIILQGFENGVE